MQEKKKEKRKKNRGRCTGILEVVGSSAVEGQRTGEGGIEAPLLLCTNTHAGHHVVTTNVFFKISLSSIERDESTTQQRGGRGTVTHEGVKAQQLEARVAGPQVSHLRHGAQASPKPNSLELPRGGRQVFEECVAKDVKFLFG